MRLAAAGAVSGAACFAVAVLAHAMAPWTVLGASAVVVLCVGGGLASWEATRARRIACGAAAVLLVRSVFGPMAALLVAVLLLAGALLRVRPLDLRYGLAAVGATVALLGRARISVVAVFCLLGLIMTLASLLIVTACTWLRRIRAPKVACPEASGGAVTVIWS